MSTLFSSTSEIILASGSPRRHTYFSDLGFSFRVIPADIVEQRKADESAKSYVRRLAQEKASVITEDYPASWIIAADTVVCLDDSVLGKPDAPEDAVKALLLLSGREHAVHTAVCLQNVQEDVLDVVLVTTAVQFWDVPVEAIQRYVVTGEPMDKAGSYGIQGMGAFLVREIRGSYSNVVGLPLCEVIELLMRHELIRK